MRCASFMSRPRLQFLDVVRGVAMLDVCLFHAADRVSGPTVLWKDGLWDVHVYGVARGALQFLLLYNFVPSLFFMISGFLIHRHLTSGRTVDLSYMVHRILRLYLPYLFVLILLSLLYYSPIPPDEGQPGLRNIGVHALLVFAYMGPTYVWAINPSFWYVAAEIQLCLMYLLWMRWVPRLGWGLLMMGLLAVEILMRIAATNVPYDWLTHNGFNFAFTWMLGAVLARILADGKLPTSAGAKAGAWMLVAYAVGAVEVLRNLSSLAYAAAVFYFLAWLLQRQGAGVTAAPAGNAPAPHGPVALLRLIGQISLWAYLLNQPLIAYIDTAVISRVPDPLARIFVITAICMITVLPLAWLMQRFVEPVLVRAGEALLRLVLRDTPVR
jgi:peptidoglycan/LPS O-acetylase OafA/YrhL